MDMKIAVISDTHDLLRPEVLDHLQGCDCILHGGKRNGFRNRLVIAWEQENIRAFICFLVFF